MHTLKARHTGHITKLVLLEVVNAEEKKKSTFVRPTSTGPHPLWDQ